MKLRRCLALLAIALLIALGLIRPGFTQLAPSQNSSPLPTVSFEYGGKQTAVPDWERITFANLPLSEEAQTQTVDFSQFVASEDGKVPTLDQIWVPGMRLDEFLKLEDIEELFEDANAPLNLGNLTLEAIAGLTLSEINLQDLKLSHLPLLGQMTLEEIVEAVPYLGYFPLQEVKPLLDLINNYSDEIDTTLSIAELLSNNKELADLALNSIQLEDFAIGSIPNLAQTSITEFDGWEESLISEIPGLNSVPLSLLGIAGGWGGMMSRIDIAYGPAESRRTNTISGSYEEGFEVPCTKECAYAEIVSMPPLGNLNPVYGKQWISGKYQKVDGGFGLLASYNGGQEPTGRHPFGEAFKVAIWEVDESKGEIETRLFFRIGSGGLLGRTPYALPPGGIPFLTFHEKDWFPLVGFLDGDGGSSTPSDLYPEEIQAAVREAERQKPEEPNFSGAPTASTGELCGEGPGGVDFNALGEAFSNIEGDYDSTGYATCDRDGNCGRGLGRYQYMTYRDDVQKVILSKPGGAEFLSRARVKNNSKAYRQQLEAELPNYFSAEDQDKLFKEDQTRNVGQAQQEIDPTTGAPFVGSRLVERLGQIHYGGAGATIDGGSSDTHGRLTVYTYGKELSENYQKSLNERGATPCSVEGDGLTTGDRANPIPSGAPITSDYGWRYRPLSGKRQFHKGIDLGAPMGTPVVATDGGTVVTVSSNSCPDVGDSATKRDCGGQLGNWIDIQHEDGTVSRYGHLQQGSVRVKPGQKVSKGQEIAGVGSSGWSTGPHLDYRVHDGKGNYRDPKPYLGI